MDQCPSSCHISSRLITGCTSKALQNILPPSVLSTTGEPLGRSSPILALTYSEAHSINLPNFVPLWKPVYEISAARNRRFSYKVHHRMTHMYRGTRPEFTKTKPRLQNFVDFGDGVTDKNTHKNTKRCLRIPRGDKKLRLCLKVPEVLVLTTER